MRTIIIGHVLISLLFSCTDSAPPKKVVPKVLEASSQQVSLEKLKDTAIVSQFNLVDVQSLNKDILVELKYATTDNFMGVILYDRLKKAYLQKDVAERLSKVQAYLSQLKPGFHLLIYDALRPVSVQQKMWDALDSLPPIERGKFVSNPKNRSLHNMGAAVDLTILDQNSVPLDMGAGYDDIRQIAYPSMEKQFVAEGKLTAVHIENRDLLRKVMKSQGFRQLQTEWWHFNACSRADGLLKYKVLFEEP
ncbi:MAG: M15 family metallopeptidase [Crocinitomicaceae bacterium]|nr:M15 family metallopeptidase [Crocinitomicaceae bacterium]MBP6032897.1 M15 family metallopeptidase [Crocinitomicaceae bacterium]